MSCSLPLASLILDEVISGYNDGSDFAVDKALDSIFPGLIETDTVDVLQNVDTGRRLANLEHGAVDKISWTETVERSPVLGECAKQHLAVFFVRPDEEIQVFPRSRVSTWVAHFASVSKRID
jgi:hypothetical protein